jgi:hypothetical protein
MSEKTPAQRKIEELEAKRAERRAKVKAAKDERLAIDLESIDAVEAEHGPDHVEVLDVPFVAADLPVRLAFRLPDTQEMDRYRSRLKGKGEPGSKGYQRGDTVKASEELADSTVVYPGPDEYARLCSTYPGIRVQGGTLAAGLAMGDEEVQGKG